MLEFLPRFMSTDLTFVTNEPGNNLRDRFNALLTKDTQFFDCLVGYFYISGFHKIYPALEHVDKVRILVGLKTDRMAYELALAAKRDGEFPFKSHAETKKEVSEDLLKELENAADTEAVETGVHRFVEWLRSGKLEIKAHPSENLHAKVYIMTFFTGDRDAGRVRRFLPRPP